MKIRDFIKISSIAIGTGAFGIYAFNLANEDNDAPLFESEFLPPKSHSKLLILSRYILPRETDAKSALKAIKLFDAYANELSPSQQDEIKQILALFDSNLLVRNLTYTPNDLNSERDVEQMLDKWKHSFDHLILGSDLHMAYKALTELFYLGFYSLRTGKRITGI